MHICAYADRANARRPRARPNVMAALHDMALHRIYVIYLFNPVKKIAEAYLRTHASVHEIQSHASKDTHLVPPEACIRHAANVSSLYALSSSTVIFSSDAQGDVVLSNSTLAPHACP